ncbi:MAG: hypothetical protein JXA07_10285 [Spirochaetes bacterium]|nr:hypothetical protein [Spirochaetota bacterium]
MSSKPNEGASFQIYLPAIESNQETNDVDEMQQEYTRGMGARVLLVENQLEVLKFTSIALQQYGYIVFQAKSLNEAFELFRHEEGRFDILFCDVVLPD